MSYKFIYRYKKIHRNSFCFLVSNIFYQKIKKIRIIDNNEIDTVQKCNNYRNVYKNTNKTWE